MAAMEQAAGVSALFEADAKWLSDKRSRLELHTQLGERSAAIADYVNAQESNDNGGS